MLQQLTVVTKKTRTLKVKSKKTSIESSNSFKESINPISEVIKTIKELQTILLRSITIDSCSITDVRDLTIIKTSNTNRHDRRVVLSQRFRK